MEPFDLKTGKADKYPFIMLKGDITDDAAEKMNNAFNSVSSEAGSDVIIFSFAESRYINSSGISLFVNLIRKHQEKNGIIIFTDLEEHLLNVMGIVGLTEYVTVCDTIDSAISFAENR